jgi:hypothetical protein
MVFQKVKISILLFGEVNITTANSSQRLKIFEISDIAAKLVSPK